MDKNWKVKDALFTGFVEVAVSLIEMVMAGGWFMVVFVILVILLS